MRMRARVSDALNLTGVLRVKGHARIADKAAPIVVQAVGGRVDLVIRASRREAGRASRGDRAEGI